MSATATDTRGAPRDIHAVAYACLMASEPSRKILLTEEAFRAWSDGALAFDERASSDDVVAVPVPGRPALPRLVHPRELPQRGLGSEEGRAALIHAVAHIEFNAINLAWDAVYRFRDLPRAYVDDWVRVAWDESRHFQLLERRLRDLGHSYGDFDAHNGLWEMALATADDALARMALVPRVLEARGLDVTPGMIRRVRGVGDEATSAILELILREEVAHVAAGTRWFRYLCDRRGVDAGPTFLDLVRTRASGSVRGPFNLSARTEAGFDEQELAAIAAL